MINHILFALASTMTIIVVILSFCNITNQKIKITPKLIIIVLLGIVITTLLNYVNIIAFKPIFSLLSFFIILKALSSKPSLEVFYYALILWLYGMFLDIISMLLFSIPFLYNLLIKLDYIIMQILAGLVVAILLFSTTKIPIIKKFINKLVKIALKLKPSVLLEVIYILALVFVNAVCVLNINKLSMHLYAIIIIALLLLLIVDVLTKTNKIRKYKELNSILVKNNDFLLGVINDYRILKHNLTGQLLGIKSVANKETKVLIDDLIHDYNAKFLSPKDISKIPSGLNGIVYEKVYSFNKPEINLAVESDIKSNLLDVIKPSVYNKLCETLGVLIDNALEAAYGSDEKSILIDLVEEKDYIYIKIVNTFSNSIDIDNLGMINESSKGKNRGIGLFSIFRKNEVKVNTSIYNNLFESTVRIKKALIN